MLTRLIAAASRSCSPRSIAKTLTPVIASTDRKMPMGTDRGLSINQRREILRRDVCEFDSVPPPGLPTCPPPCTSGGGASTDHGLVGNQAAGTSFPFNQPDRTLETRQPFGRSRTGKDAPLCI